MAETMRVECGSCGYSNRVSLKDADSDDMKYVAEASGWTPTDGGKYLCEDCAKNGADSHTSVRLYDEAGDGTTPPLPRGE